ncbi:MAG: hypothetical protein A3K19_29170 [Lentisphaerae bacterium RIFOXYB12_FULL_65_16]|nr:MAG: hypothetical protein A3K18_04560 [Lentisphaerae bacterium RIFOXYA12_64_32]OGV88370.1 MAG: hypothetical protein A3K19_29170 [Lentisphaerae bacterium RIFOXYB12_FULL_65_16]
MDAETKCRLVEEIIRLEGKAEQLDGLWKAQHVEFVRTRKELHRRRKELLGQYHAVAENLQE